MRRILLLLIGVVMATAVWLFVLPGPVDPAAWNPPPDPGLTGVAAPNDALRDADLIGAGQIVGAEDVAVDAQGRIYGGLQDGRIVRVLPDGTIETFADTGGRPLGLDWDPQGNLVVADAYAGLLSIDPSGSIAVLSTGAQGVPFGFTDDLDVASDGRVYFSDASSRFAQAEYILDLLETRPYGRLLVYDPATDATEVLLDELYFANGVALSAREDFVLVNETWRYRIIRYWLKGPRAGEHEVFIDNLPGFPDGVSGNGRGTFWLALPSTRKANVDAMHPKPWLKRVVAKLPPQLRPKAVHYGLVLALDETGRITASYHDRTGEHLREITSVEEHGGAIYLGTLGNDRIGRLALADQWTGASASPDSDYVD